MIRLLTWILLLISISCYCDAQERFALQLEWRFKRSDASGWMSATVPGSVHTDLIRAKKIDHPFNGTNESKCQWIEEKQWLYETLPFTFPLR